MCPLCKCENFTIIGMPEVNTSIKSLLKKKYFIVKCKECYFYFLDPILEFTKEEFKELYNESYFVPMSSFYEILRKKNRILRFNKIENYASRKIINFLDIGCGEGLTLIEANSRGWKVSGVDIFDNRTEKAKTICENFILGNLFEAKFPDNHFDVIYIDSVLEHIVTPFEYLLEMNRILKQGGVIYIGVPNEDCFLNDLRKIVNFFVNKKNISAKLKPFKSPYHIGGFNNKSLQCAVKNAGFELVTLRNFAGRLNFLNPKIFSREFWIAVLLIPVNIIALIIRKEEYLETYIRKQKI